MVCPAAHQINHISNYLFTTEIASPYRLRGLDHHPFKVKDRDRRPVGMPDIFCGAKVFMDAHQPVTLEEGDRYPLVPPRKPL